MSTKKELVSVSINISGRNYPVKVEESKVQSVKKIEKDLNEKVRNYEFNYKDLDRVDSLTMTLITQAFDLQQSQNLNQNKKLMDQLNSLESLVDQALA